MRNELDNTALQAIFEHSNIGIIVSNYDGDIVELNPYVTMLFGYDEAELLGFKLRPVRTLLEFHSGSGI